MTERHMITVCVTGTIVGAFVSMGFADTIRGVAGCGFLFGAILGGIAIREEIAARRHCWPGRHRWQRLSDDGWRCGKCGKRDNWWSSRTDNTATSTR